MKPPIAYLLGLCFWLVEFVTAWSTFFFFFWLWHPYHCFDSCFSYPFDNWMRLCVVLSVLLFVWQIYFIFLLYLSLSLSFGPQQLLLHEAEQLDAMCSSQEAFLANEDLGVRWSEFTINLSSKLWRSFEWFQQWLPWRERKLFCTVMQFQWYQQCQFWVLVLLCTKLNWMNIWPHSKFIAFSLSCLFGHRR